MSAISRLTRQQHEVRRTDRGESRIPAVWRAVVVYVRETTAESGARAGVYVRVPRLTGDEIVGPLGWVGGKPTEGSRVLVAAVEGRRDQLVILNPGDHAEMERRLDEVETTLGGPVWDRLGSHELALQMVEDTFEAHGLGSITWLTASSGRIQIPGYVPQPVARSYRLEMDVVTEDHASTGAVWIRVMGNNEILIHLNLEDQMNRSGDTHRYRFQLDFNAPTNAALEVAHSQGLRNPSSGRAGYTRPMLSTPIVRSA